MIGPAHTTTGFDTELELNLICCTTKIVSLSLSQTTRQDSRTRENRINVANRTVFHGDNLKFLRGINSGTVHLIATDPPFKKDKDFYATHDSLASGARFSDRWKWDVDVHDAWSDSIKDDLPAVWQVIEAANVAYGENMGAYLCWLGVRLLEMRRVLRDDGSIYVHTDHTAHAWVKTLMDGIFGQDNFRNEIVWAYTGPGSPKMRQFNRKHDTILWYCKGSKWTFNKDAVRVPYKDGKPHTGGFTHASGKKAGQNMDAEVAGSYTDGKILESWWSDIALAVRSSKERVGYPTQKPIKLYERIIQASSNPGDFVLDPFAGCATTPVAAERLGRQWIGMDLWEGAHNMVLKRLQAEGLAVEGQSDGRLLTFGDVHYSTAPPIRSDDNEVAAPDLKLKERIVEPPGRRMTRAEMKQTLIDMHGKACQGCDREFDDERYLELDHNTPRSSGGINHISNRLLLCGPCNRVKSNKFTKEGLRQRNKQEGWMSG